MSTQPHLFRHNGAGSRDGFTVRYMTPFGWQTLLNAEGKPDVFSKKDAYAASYGANNGARKATKAMSSTAWSRI